MKYWVAAALALFACSSDASKGASDAGAAAMPYPPGPYGTGKGAILENRTLDGLTAAGVAGKVSYADLRSKPLLIRVGAGFCGTCRVSAEHATDALPQAVRDRVTVLDVLVRDEDAALPTLDAAQRWQGRQDVPTAVVVDPAMTLVVDDQKLPRVLVVDPQSMTITEDLSDPTPDEIATAVGVAPAGEPLVDGRFTKPQWQMFQDMILKGGPPADPTNKWGDRAGAAAFGAELFEDDGLGTSGFTTCKSCHEPDRQFTDGQDKPTRGVGHATRNTPTAVLAAWQRWQFWDGRADTLWAQAIGPIENPDEFASDRTWVAHRMDQRWRVEYESVFGPMPLVDDPARFPSHAKPGDPAWSAMAPGDQQIVTQVMVNVAKSLAAYERTFRVLPNRPDKYAMGDATALTDDEKDGLKAYFTAGCAQCHWGPRLTDDAFHALRFPSGHEDFTPDNGRIDGDPKYETSEFRADGAWSDAPQPKRNVSVGAEQLGAFKTPGLRGVVLTSPYGHGGGIASIDIAIEMHRTRGMPAGARLTNGNADPWAVSFDQSLSKPLNAFVSTLDFAR